MTEILGIILAALLAALWLLNERAFRRERRARLAAEAEHRTLMDAAIAARDEANRHMAALYEIKAKRSAAGKLGWETKRKKKGAA